jgi:hypothetical protein
MATLNISEKDQNAPSSIFTDCERAFSLIKEGKEKQAEDMFPWECYLIHKYLYLDLKNLSTLLEDRLTITGQ